VNGGQTILNPWMTVGGAATSICQPNEYIMCVTARLSHYLLISYILVANFLNGSVHCAHWLFMQ